MRFDCFVLDFDGTFTDVEVEGAPYVAAYRRALADLLGRDVDADWARFAAEIAKNPAAHGWLHGGHVVAPGNADPYVRSTAIAQQIFDAAGVLRDPELRTAIVQAFYQLAYRHTVTAFRPDARATLEALIATGVPVHVVTNSRTDVVAKKLHELAPAGVEKLRVLGDAQKYVITDAETADPRFAALPATKALPGLARPAYVRRGRYFDTLARLWRDLGTGPERTLVIGDIFELDLLLPAELGAHVHLVTGPATSAFERAALAALGARGGSGDRIGDVLTRLG